MREEEQYMQLDDKIIEEKHSLLFDSANHVSSFLKELHYAREKREACERISAEITVAFEYLSCMCKLLETIIPFQLKLTNSPLHKLKLLISKNKKYEEQIDEYYALSTKLREEAPGFSITELQNDSIFETGYVGYITRQLKIVSQQKNDSVVLLKGEVDRLSSRIAEMEDCVKESKSLMSELKKELFNRNFLDFNDELAECVKYMTPQQKADFEYIAARYRNKEEMKWCIDITQIVRYLQEVLEENKANLENMEKETTALGEVLQTVKIVNKSIEAINRINMRRGE